MILATVFPSRCARISRNRQFKREPASRRKFPKNRPAPWHRRSKPRRASEFQQTLPKASGKSFCWANESYTYDAAGNRETTTTGTAATDTLQATTSTTTTGNQLESDGTFIYSYDADGNVVQKERISQAEAPDFKTVYSYDNAGRLVEATTEDNTDTITQNIVYTYNSLGERVGETVTVGGTSTVTKFAYDLDGNVAATFDGSNNLTGTYVYGQAVDQLLAQEDGSGNVNWMTTDRDQSVRDVVQYNGTTSVVDHIDYNSFGVTISESNPSAAHIDGYAGYVNDLALGMLETQSRIYNPSTGEFISQDPSGFSGSPNGNLYEYAGNSPVDMVDPSGLSQTLPTATLNFPTQSSLQYAFAAMNAQSDDSSDGSSDVEPTDEDTSPLISFTGLLGTNSSTDDVEPASQQSPTVLSTAANLLFPNASQLFNTATSLFAGNYSGSTPMGAVDPASAWSLNVSPGSVQFGYANGMGQYVGPKSFSFGLNASGLQVGYSSQPSIWRTPGESTSFALNLGSSGLQSQYLQTNSIDKTILSTSLNVSSSWPLVNYSSGVYVPVDNMNDGSIRVGTGQQITEIDPSGVANFGGTNYAYFADQGTQARDALGYAINSNGTIDPTNQDTSGWTGTPSNWKPPTLLQSAQTMLNLIGIADQTGIADGTNALLYLAQGQWKNAGMSALGAIPLLGTFASEISLGAKIADGLDDASDALRIANGLDDVSDAARIADNVSEFSNCFPAGTPVSTSDGLKPIENIGAGDMVWAFDLTSGDWKLRPVLETYAFRHDGDLVTLTVDGENIAATDMHPFWVLKGEKLDSRPRPDHIAEAPDGTKVPGRWVDARDLRVGDMLLLKDGRQLPVTALATKPVSQAVYNFQVDDLHCYAVGTSEVLVHNNCGGVIYGTPQGTLITAPAGYQAVTAQNGKGLVLMPKGQILGNNSNIIRYGDPNATNPNGYVRYYNASGQPLVPSTGKPGSNPATHIDINYTGPLVGYPQ
jgi:RHS repeat-associated protein